MRNTLVVTFYLTILLLGFGCNKSPEAEVSSDDLLDKGIVSNSSSEPLPSEFTPCIKKYNIPGVDLCLAWESVPQETLEMNSNFAFELRLFNFGDSDAEDSVVSVWANNIQLSDSSQRFSCKTNGSKLDCKVPKLKSNDNIVLRLDGKPFAAGDLTMTAVAENDSDENLSNNEAKPFPKIKVNSAVVRDDYTSKFLAIREKCAAKYGSDKLSLRKCMLEARKAGQL